MNAEKAAVQRRSWHVAMVRLGQYRSKHPYAVAKRRFWTRVATAAEAERRAILTAYLARRAARVTAH